MMTENKRFRKVMGFIQDNTCEGGDVEGVMDLTEIEDMLNRLNDENKKLRIVNEMMSADMAGTERELNEKIETLEKEIVKLENEWEYLLEENTRLEKFFLHNCKSQDFIDWVKMLAEEGGNCKRQ